MLPAQGPIQARRRRKVLIGEAACRYPDHPREAFAAKEDGDAARLAEIVLDHAARLHASPPNLVRSCYGHVVFWIDRRIGEGAAASPLSNHAAAGIDLVRLSPSDEGKSAARAFR